MALLGEVTRGSYRLETFSTSGVAEAKVVLEQYAGFGDASNVVLARRHDMIDVLTLDERHFRTLRDPRELPFRLLPADLQARRAPSPKPWVRVRGVRPGG